MRFQTYFNSLSESECDNFVSHCQLVSESFENNTFKEFCLETSTLDELCNDFDEFNRKCCQENPTFAFWSVYIEMVEVLLLYIRATRTSDRALHLSALRSMIPWFFITDRINCARYSPCYWLEMSCLDKTHPCKCITIYSFLSISIGLDKCN